VESQVVEQRPQATQFVMASHHQIAGVLLARVIIANQNQNKLEISANSEPFNNLFHGLPNGMFLLMHDGFPARMDERG
jgi:hypothetical protein